METEATHGRIITRGFALPALLVMCTLTLLTCDGPSAPQLDELSNVYDPESDNYIPMPNIRTASATGIRALRAESGGQFATTYGTPVTAKGVCWSTEEEPTLEDDCTNDGQGHGEFTSTMHGLDPDQTYYVRAYATNEAGTVYGDQRSFTTLDGRPEVSIELDIKKTSSIRVKGEIFSEIEAAPVTSYGVCYDEEPNPGMHSECVSHHGETGSYAIELDGLEAGTSYHVFAFAVNEIGSGSSEIIETTTFLWLRDTDTEVVEITNPVTGQVWMDRNLGASRVATSSNDEQAFGDLYQWGRPADGHQKRNSDTTSTLSDSDQPGHGSFITSGSDDTWDWRSPQNDNLWQGEIGVNNPCPAGFRLPTEAEWGAERNSWNSYNSAGAYASLLKLPVAGHRGGSGSLMSVGSIGYYWSSTLSGSYLSYLYFSSDAAGTEGSNARVAGLSVRCIKD